MGKIGTILLILGIVIAGILAYFRFAVAKKISTTIVPRPSTIMTSSFANAPNYQVYGHVTKWFPNSDILEVNLYLGKTVTLKVGDASRSYVLAPNPKDRTKITVLIKNMYTSQEWAGAFCPGDVLLIGTKENVWKKITNYMQITPNFVNVEDRPCYNLPSQP